MPERWADGIINQKTWQLWQLFEEKGMLNISQVRHILGANRRKGVSSVDAAIQQLQHEYYITLDGNDRKISAKGEPYGWPVNRYRRVIDWAPAGWLGNSKEWSVGEAKELPLEKGMAMSDNVNRKDLARKLVLR